MRWLAIALLIAAPARADVENDIGLGARAAALANSVGAVGGDYAATVYNPGALVVPSDRPGFAELSLGAIIVVPSLWVAPTDEAMMLDRSVEVVPVQNTYALAAGARFDIGNCFGLPGLALGIAFYAPFDGLVQSVIRPDDTPFWLTHTDRTQHIALFAALAYRITEWLSLGAGVRITFDEEVFITGTAEDIRIETDPETGMETIRAGAHLGVETAIYGRASPALGVLVSPLPNLRFGFAWRGRLRSDDWGWSRLQGIEAVGDLGFLHRFMHVYRPHELSLSGAYAPIPELEITAELTWAMWSQARTPNWTNAGGRFGDTWIPAIGARATPYPGVEVLGGYRYAQRVYDDFGGPTNLLTNNAHSIGLGVALDLDALIEDEVPFTVTLAGRLTILEDREEVKNGRRFPDDRSLTENPGYPGYRYGGFVPSMQLDVEAEW